VTTPAAPGSRRVEFIDLLRGWAVIVMIETHVVNATLLPALRQSDFHHVLTFLNGLVAPTFVFASGMAFAITLRRKIADYIRWTPVLAKQIGRLLMILAIGYILHIPKFSLRHLLYVAEEPAWRDFFQVDVLQTIAATLLLLQALLLALRTERRLYLTVAILSFLVVFLTPVVRTIHFTEMLPLPIAAYLNPEMKWQFSLFPWAAFLFCGALTGFLFLELREQLRKYLLWGGVGVILLSFALHPLLAQVYPAYNYWRGSPSFFLLRLGIVLILAWALYTVELKKGVRPSSLVTLVGRESLMVYVAHLFLIYGDFGTFNFNAMVHRSFGYAEAAGVSLVLIALMCLLAYVWGRIKRGPLKARRIVEWAFITILAAVFVFAPA
jgi:uncharacterized membrane protein